MHVRAFALTVLLAAVLACSKSERDASPSAAKSRSAEGDPVGTVTVEQLDSLVTSGQCQVVDANGESTRRNMGIIPGATLLTSYETYSVHELPADKARKLVFYCANEHCGASHVAAERAIAAGYRDVHVLPAGIAGWHQAGKTVQPL